MKRKKEMLQPVAQAVQTASSEPFAGLDACVSGRCERRLYAALRSSVPIVDAALNKIVRLLGRFEIDCGNREVSYQLNDFLMNVRVWTLPPQASLRLSGSTAGSALSRRKTMWWTVSAG